MHKNFYPLAGVTTHPPTCLKGVTLYICTKGIQKVRSFYYKMTSQLKNFAVMIKFTIIEVSTQNFMFTTFLVSSLEFFKRGGTLRKIWIMAIQNDV